ncbi:YqjF family protein [Halorussus caseinilyticus]|uniref:YqjF family protein n=1 Tax=Halorussus caseinilyticus TaxID=3034025 RepID=A0ABD5WKJ1_9EURY
MARRPVRPLAGGPLAGPTAVPDELDVDTREGTAWVSALPSLVAASRPWFLPERVGLTFPQVNLRTYVRYGGRPGVYFLSLDAPTELGVRLARSVWDLPYHLADIDFETTGDVRRFDCQRVHTDESPARFAAEYRPTGRPAYADPDSLSAFLAERYRLYLVRGGSRGGSGTVWCARVEHDPWRLCPVEATVHADALLESVGLPAPAEDPVVHFAPSATFRVRTPFRPRAQVPI